jgi:hypothetical protein
MNDVASNRDYASENEKKSKHLRSTPLLREDQVYQEAPEDKI